MSTRLISDKRYLGWMESIVNNWYGSYFVIDLSHLIALYAIDTSGVVWGVGYNGTNAGLVGNKDSARVVKDMEMSVWTQEDSSRHMQSMYVASDDMTLWLTRDGRLFGCCPDSFFYHIPCEARITTLSGGFADDHAFARNAKGDWWEVINDKQVPGKFKTQPLKVPYNVTIQEVVSCAGYNAFLTVQGQVYVNREKKCEHKIFKDLFQYEMRTLSDCLKTRHIKIPDEREIFDGNKVTSIQAGDAFIGCLDHQGRVWTIGPVEEEEGLLGFPIEIDDLVEMKIKIIQIAVGYRHIAVLSEEGNVYVHGNLEDEDSTSVKICVAENMVSLQSGYDHLVAKDRTGKWWTMGCNGYAQVSGLLKPIERKDKETGNIVYDNQSTVKWFGEMKPVDFSRIEEESGGMKVVKIFLGCAKTMVIVN